MTSFGLALPAFASPGAALFRTPALPQVDPQLCLDLAREADEAGFDSLWAPDHLMIGREDAVLEGWTLMSAVAAVTRRARIGLIQQSNLFRAPGPSARALATLDALSGRRAVYFCGLGAKPENDAYGLADGLDEEGRAERLIEAVAVMRSLWSGAVVNHRGRHYLLEGAHGASVAAPPLWFASLRPDVLSALAPIASGWSTSPVSPAEAARRYDAVAEALVSAGRSPDEIEYGLETQILVADDLAGLRAKLREMMALAARLPSPRPAVDPAAIDAFLHGRTDEIPAALTERWLVGTPADVAARIGAYRAAGTTHFVLWFMDVPSRDGMLCFQRRVRPLIPGDPRDAAEDPAAGAVSSG